MKLTQHYKERSESRGYSNEWLESAIQNGDLLIQESQSMIINLEEAKAERLRKNFASVESEARHARKLLEREKRKARSTGDTDTERLDDAIREQRFLEKQARRKKRRMKAGFAVLEPSDSKNGQDHSCKVCTVGKRYKKLKLVQCNFEK
ncbi:MAG: hypothetical protein C9356_02685 [Oleiphilus sp.]|nr:MAG: hypothetical protein C9356_02685 [Oleiphilus sp.]